MPHDNDWYCRRVLSGELPVTELYRSPEDDALLLELMTTARRFAQELEAAHGGCVVSTNVRDFQSPASKHLHIHVAAGQKIRED